jgi:hypothetical protein
MFDVFIRSFVCVCTAQDVCVSSVRMTGGRDADARSRPQGNRDASSSGVVDVYTTDGKSTHCCMTMGDLQ